MQSGVDTKEDEGNTNGAADSEAQTPSLVADLSNPDPKLRQLALKRSNNLLKWGKAVGAGGVKPGSGAQGDRRHG